MFALPQVISTTTMTRAESLQPHKLRVLCRFPFEGFRNNFVVFTVRCTRFHEGQDALCRYAAVRCREFQSGISGTPKFAGMSREHNLVPHEMHII